MHLEVAPLLYKTETCLWTLHFHCLLQGTNLCCRDNPAMRENMLCGYNLCAIQFLAPQLSHLQDPAPEQPESSPAQGRVVVERLNALFCWPQDGERHKGLMRLPKAERRLSCTYAKCQALRKSREAATGAEGKTAGGSQPTGGH